MKRHHNDPDPWEEFSPSQDGVPLPAPTQALRRRARSASRLVLAAVAAGGALAGGAFCGWWMDGTALLVGVGTALGAASALGLWRVAGIWRRGVE
ncbi:MAG: hypothetical protein SF028_09905 [Candidatus Sumerlaeia bacterium]|nr:hypothetical protein [Candidatus Sumerlaeia bacterium]